MRSADEPRTSLSSCPNYPGAPNKIDPHTIPSIPVVPAYNPEEGLSMPSPRRPMSSAGIHHLLVIETALNSAASVSSLQEKHITYSVVMRR